MPPYFLLPVLITADAIEVADRKSPLRQGSLFIAVERRQLLQQFAIRHGTHDVGREGREQFLPRVTDLFEIELRRGYPARAGMALLARPFAGDQTRQRFDLGRKFAIARYRHHESMTPVVAHGARLA